MVYYILFLFWICLMNGHTFVNFLGRCKTGVFCCCFFGVFFSPICGAWVALGDIKLIYEVKNISSPSWKSSSKMQWYLKEKAAFLLLLWQVKRSQSMWGFIGNCNKSHNEGRNMSGFWLYKTDGITTVIYLYESLLCKNWIQFKVLSFIWKTCIWN